MPPDWAWGTAVARTDWRTVSKLRGRAPLRGDLMHETTRNLLAVLADLDDEALVDGYGILRGEDAPLDLAIYAWRDAGSPDVTNAPTVEAEAAAEAAFRAEPGVVEYVDHLGQPAWGRLVEDGHEVRIRRPGATPAGLGYAGRWPETVRLRTHGGRIAHLWRGTGQALCRRWLRRPTFAPDDLRTCPACAAKEVARG